MTLRHRCTLKDDEKKERSICTTPLPGTNSSHLCSSGLVSAVYECVSMHVYVSCVDPIISLALLSSPVCLSRALCLLGAACPPKRLLQRNHFKNFTGSHIHTCTQTWAGSAEIGHGLLICDLDLSRHPSY